MANGLPNWNFDGRVVVVTNATSLRGAAQVAAFTTAGAKVYACDSVKPVAAAAAASVEVVVADLSVESNAASLAKRVFEQDGRLDVLVVNDSNTMSQPLVEVSDNAWQKLLTESVTTGFLVAKHLAPLMFAKGYGKVVFTTGPESRVGISGRAHVCATRHAIVGMAKDFALDAAVYRVNVNVASAAPEVDARGDRAAIDSLTHAVLWLSSDAARFVTGSVVSADVESRVVSA